MNKTERYIKARQYLGITPTWIAKNTGISRPTIKKAETVEDYFSAVYTLFLVRKGISLVWLEKNEGDMIIKKSDCEQEIESLRNEVSFLNEKISKQTDIVGDKDSTLQEMEDKVALLTKETSFLHKLLELQNEKIALLKREQNSEKPNAINVMSGLKTGYLKSSLVTNF